MTSLNDNSRRIGERLRGIRSQQGLSLADVQERSGGRWKAVVVGAYERGDRAVTVSRLAGLAAFYGVPLTDLLPGPTIDLRDDVAGDAPGRVTIDLTKLDEGDAEVRAVARFVDHVGRLRGDHNGRVMTLRGSDLTTIALTVGSDDERLRAALEREGAIVSSTR